MPWSSSFGVTDSNTQGCHEPTSFSAVRLIPGAPVGLLRSWWRCCLQAATVLPQRHPSSCGYGFPVAAATPALPPAAENGCRSCRERGGKQGWGRQLVWEDASKRDFSWAWKTQLAKLDKGACWVEERNLSWWQKIVFQMQDDEPSLQKVRMTQATFQEIWRKHSTKL